MATKKEVDETKGRGGVRPGAGRPKGSKRNLPTKIIRLSVDVANWVKAHEDEINRLISGEKILVSPKKHKRI